MITWFEKLRKWLGFYTQREQYLRGYEWAKEELLNGMSADKVESFTNDLDADSFDRGVSEALREE